MQWGKNLSGQQVGNGDQALRGGERSNTGGVCMARDAAVAMSERHIGHGGRFAMDFQNPIYQIEYPVVSDPARA